MQLRPPSLPPTDIRSHGLTMLPCQRSERRRALAVELLRHVLLQRLDAFSHGLDEHWYATFSSQSFGSKILGKRHNSVALIHGLAGY